MWLYLKDKFIISNEAWHEIAIKANDLPNIYSIKKQINELNSKWNLKPTPGDAKSVQLGFAESLQEHIAGFRRMEKSMMEKLLRSSLVVMVQILERGLQLSTSLLLFSMKRMWQWV